MTARCDDCAADYDLHPVLARDVWERISNGAYSLCIVCTAKRLDALGITAECDVVFGLPGLRSRARPPMWRYPEVVALGRVGLLAPFETHQP
jgi:hypothetical protein